MANKFSVMIIEIKNFPFKKKSFVVKNNFINEKNLNLKEFISTPEKISKNSLNIATLIIPESKKWKQLKKEINKMRKNKIKDLKSQAK